MVPGLANRIVKMAEEEGRFRRLRTMYPLRTARVSLYVAATVVLAMTGGSFYVILQGKEVVGISAIVAELVALATVFIVGKRANDRDPDGEA